MKLQTGLIIYFFLFLTTVLVAKENTIQCANLIYGGTHTSRCFSDEFLRETNLKTSVRTERRFKSVKLASENIFQVPFLMMTGEDNFHLTPRERKNLKKYLNNGGFLLASAGCSSKKWNQAFQREMKSIFEKDTLESIPMNHPLFHTVKDIDELILDHQTHGEKARLQGIEIDGKLAVVYSPHGLNDTAHTEGCCCCGGNEIDNALEVNVNILVYALLH